ncbi:unnamed protein product [Discosporangium mesarthrocarpum]
MKFNQAIFARLRLREGQVEGGGGEEQSVCVGTYHMPCMFMCRPVMVIHTALLMRHMAKLANRDPLVVAGDFNFSPGSECYRLVTEGNLEETSPDFPASRPWERDWTAELPVKMKSAYKEVEGREPDFTNNAKVFFPYRS